MLTGTLMPLERTIRMSDHTASWSSYFVLPPAYLSSGRQSSDKVLSWELRPLPLGPFFFHSLRVSLHRNSSADSRPARTAFRGSFSSKP